ncbi:ATP phosphoribosyltransferase regulatory subunit [Amylibacter marinus]|uniref:ATP phosphoribosyltransferase regulatory subunit n=1 Tax=Amylibacter marinus TaxID=1475483 RepID=A0ABQ5VYF2_9RHOB|nr:ATP phosphoribosyltransferase regulatory subunit [Amylibacter marinus]GLQ36224.1 ATP phosphoribosyltransferase regulatory subunit [Amylibacter marinus]
MQNDRRAAIRAEAARLEAAFADAGALRIEADALLPAEVLLDLYGEDIRSRAYVTHDPVLGERMLRPDFTLPIVEQHMTEGEEPARYTYNGPVWRMQDAGSSRATEFVQVGFELFDRADPAGSDAEVFALFRDLMPDGLEVHSGDVGLLRAAVDGLKTSARRRAALTRHLWRPERFRRLLARFSGAGAQPLGRAEMLAKVEALGAQTMIDTAGKFIGLRSVSEIEARIEGLRADSTEAPLSAEEVAAINALLSLKDNCAAALGALNDLAETLVQIRPALVGFQRRLDALDARGIDLAKLPFEGSYGLTSMEYYDGFVFSFAHQGTVIASGGRYDALTTVLGNGRHIPAVGGVIRPDLLLAQKEAM